MTDGFVPNVLLSIRPEHADAILDGAKAWEYRRVAPAVEPPYRAVLYATEPVAAAVGAAWVPDVLTGPPETVVARTVAETPHDPLAVRDYLDGAGAANALRVKGPRRFGTPLARSTLDAAGVPPSQNFRYLPDIPAEYDAEAGVISV